MKVTETKLTSARGDADKIGEQKSAAEDKLNTIASELDGLSPLLHRENLSNKSACAAALLMYRQHVIHSPEYGDHRIGYHIAKDCCEAGSLNCAGRQN